MKSSSSISVEKLKLNRFIFMFGMGVFLVLMCSLRFGKFTWRLNMTGINKPYFFYKLIFHCNLSLSRLFLEMSYNYFSIFAHNSQNKILNLSLFFGETHSQRNETQIVQITRYYQTEMCTYNKNSYSSLCSFSRICRGLRIFLLKVANWKCCSCIYKMCMLMYRI